MADGKALVRPEISVVLAYSKMWLFDELASDLPDDLRPWMKISSAISQTPSGAVEQANS